MDEEHRKDEECHAVISALPDIVFILTESGSYGAIYGGDSSNYYHDGASLEGSTIFDVLPEDKANWFLARIRETLDNNRLMVFEYSLDARDVKRLDVEVGPKGLLRFEGRVNPLKSLRYGERAVVWVARNITKRYQLEQELIYQSEIDFLSGTYNRRKLFKHLDEAFYNFQRYQDNYSFMLIDIDNFKNVNDTYGHQTGDKMIRKIANACKAELRHSDVIGRLGGDEFGVIHKITSETSHMALAQRLNNLVNEIDSDTNCTYSVSIGFSQFDLQDSGTEQIYHRADLALYKAKRQGKNRFSNG